jgi:hypothetical protein
MIGTLIAGAVLNVGLRVLVRRWLRARQRRRKLAALTRTAAVLADALEQEARR